MITISKNLNLKHLGIKYLFIYIISMIKEDIGDDDGWMWIICINKL